MGIYAKHNRDNKVDNLMSKKKQKFDLDGESKVVQHDFANRKKFHPHDLVSFPSPTPRQERFFESYYAGTPILGLLGYPGSGKSFAAIYAGLSSVFEPSDPIEKLVIVRSIEQSGPNTGALPGDISEKVEIFEAAYVDLTRQMMSFNNPYKHLKSLGNLEFMPTNFLRGVTFDNTVVVLEEAQNLDWDEIYTVVSRLGMNSRLILTGDIRQSDLQRRRRKGGLERLEKVLLNMPYGSSEVIYMKLEDVVRSGVVRDFVISDFELSDQ